MKRKKEAKKEKKIGMGYRPSSFIVGFNRHTYPSINN